MLFASTKSVNFFKASISILQRTSRSRSLTASNHHRPVLHSLPCRHRTVHIVARCTTTQASFFRPCSAAHTGEPLPPALYNLHDRKRQVSQSTDQDTTPWRRGNLSCILWRLSGRARGVIAVTQGLGIGRLNRGFRLLMLQKRTPMHVRARIFSSAMSLRKAILCFDLVCGVVPLADVVFAKGCSAWACQCTGTGQGSCKLWLVPGESLESLS